MESTLFRFIFRYSRKEQIALLVLTGVSFPFLYYSLDLPKLIINKAIGGSEFPRVFLGHKLDQIPYLMALCTVFLLLVLVNGAFKYVINVYRGVVGERMLRRLRYQLFRNVMRFPLPQFRRVSQGEIVAMITGETQALGDFIGESIALPAFQGGTLLTILVFMFVQDWKLGLAAVSLYPLQMYLIPRLQRRVNQLKKTRVVRVRKLSERIGEVVSGIEEVHTHDTAHYELADYSERIGELYHILFGIYRWKFLIKFLNNFIAQLTPFFFYTIGGWLVISGGLTFGALVAVLAAYKDLSSPWKELLDYYQAQADARIKYELLVEGFEPAGLLDERLLDEQPEQSPPLEGPLVMTNLDLRDEGEGEHAFEGGLTVRFDLPQRVAVLGGPASGKERVATIIAGLRRPLSGSVSIDGVNLLDAPRAVTGRHIAYVGREPHLRTGSLRDNLLYSLKHRPVREALYDEEQAAARAARLRDAEMAGNSLYDINADWVDYASAGVSGPEQLTERALEVLRLADMDQDVYMLGLQGAVDPVQRPDLAERILSARETLRDRLREPEHAPLVEVFDGDRYNTNMTVAENLLFGTPRDPAFEVENLASNAYVRKVLHEAKLMDDFLAIGRRVAALMVDLFADVSPDSELFEQYSFIDADDLPEFRRLLAHTEEGRLGDLDRAERIRLLSLPFKLIVSRHRLGLIDEVLQARVLDARRQLARGFGEGSPPVAFFHPHEYNPSLSLQDNILFGRLAYGRARGGTVIGELIGEVVEKLDLRRTIMEVGLEAPVGIAGSRLSAAQRLKVSIARCLLKHPDLLVVDEATAALDPATQRKILANLFAEFQGRGLIWVLQHASLAAEFDHSVILQGGRVVEQGRFAELNRPESQLQRLLAEG